MHISTLFLTIPNLIKKIKNAGNKHFRSFSISIGPNNQRFWKFLFYKNLGHFGGLPNLLLYKMSCAVNTIENYVNTDS